MKVRVIITKEYEVKPENYDNPKDETEFIARVVDYDGNMETQLETITQENSTAMLNVYDDNNELLASFDIDDKG